MVIQISARSKVLSIGQSILGKIEKNKRCEGENTDLAIENMVLPRNQIYDSIIV